MEKHRTVIEPPSYLSLNIKEIWQYRELFYFFTWRDIKVKYKQTYLGIAWVLLQPLTMMFLFTVVFKRIINTASDMPYEIYVLSGLINWNLFHSSVSNAATSIIEQSNIIKKIYFPRLVIPLAACLVAFVDYIISFGIFFVFCIVYKHPPNWSLIFSLPISLFILLISAVGTGTFLSALTVKYRDFRYIVPFILQFLFFSTQVVYSLNNIENNWLRYLLAINPVNGAIELFRLPFTVGINKTVVAISTCSSFLLGAIGYTYFRRAEAYFADQG